MSIMTFLQWAGLLSRGINDSECVTVLGPKKASWNSWCFVHITVAQVLLSKLPIFIIVIQKLEYKLHYLLQYN